MVRMKNEDATFVGFKNMPCFFWTGPRKKVPRSDSSVRALPVRGLFTGAPALVSKEPVYLPCCSATIFSMSSNKGTTPNIRKAVPRCFKVVKILGHWNTNLSIHTTRTTRLISSFFGVVVPSAELGSRGGCHSGVTVPCANLLLLRTHAHIPSPRSHLKSDITRHAHSTHNPERCPIRGVSPSPPRFHYREGRTRARRRGNTKAHRTERPCAKFDSSKLLSLVRNVGRCGCGGEHAPPPFDSFKSDCGLNIFGSFFFLRDITCQNWGNAQRHSTTRSGVSRFSPQSSVSKARSVFIRCRLDSRVAV